MRVCVRVRVCVCGACACLACVRVLACFEACISNQQNRLDLETST